MSCYGIDERTFDLGPCLQDVLRALPIAVLALFGFSDLFALRKRSDRKRYGRRGKLLLSFKLVFAGTALALQLVLLIVASIGHRTRGLRIAANAATLLAMVCSHLHKSEERG